MISDNFYKFYGQTDAQEISHDYHNRASDKGVGQGAFIVGSGYSFTIFAKNEAVSSGIPNKLVTVMSGQLEGNSIKDFQYSLVIIEKTGDDNNSVLIPVNAGRIWKDGDGISESIDNFRLQRQGLKVNGDSVNILNIRLGLIVITLNYSLIHYANLRNRQV